MKMPQIQRIQSGSIRRQAVSDDHLRLYRLIVQQAFQ
jgi:hypothetical protein